VILATQIKDKDKNAGKYMQTVKSSYFYGWDNK
jgi:hypothetical protein